MINKCLIFTSKTCKECFALEQNYERLQAMFSAIEFVVIEITENPKVAIEHQIYTVPSIELYNEIEKVAEFKHGTNKTYEHIENFIKVHTLLAKEKR